MFRLIRVVLDPAATSSEAHAAAEDAVRRLGAKHPSAEWLKTCLVRTSRGAFDREHVKAVLKRVLALLHIKTSRDGVVLGNLTAAAHTAAKVAASAVTAALLATEHLATLARASPELFAGRGAELLAVLNHTEVRVAAQISAVVALAGSALRRDTHAALLWDTLATASCEGTRAQAKNAARALMAMEKTNTNTKTKTHAAGEEDATEDKDDDDDAGGGRGRVARVVFDEIVDAWSGGDVLESNLPAVLGTVHTMVRHTYPVMSCPVPHTSDQS